MYITIPVSGLIRFSKLTSETLNINSGDRISFFEDDSLEGNWFFKISKDGEFSIKEYWNGQKTSSYLAFGSTRLKQEIWDSLCIEDKSVNLYIEEEIKSEDQEIFYKLEVI